MDGILELLQDADLAGLGIVCTGVLALPWAVHAARLARRGAPMSALAATAPLALIPAFVVAGALDAMQVPAGLQADQVAYAWARAVGQTLSLPIVAWLAALPAAVVLCFVGARGPVRPGVSVLVPAGCVVVASVVPWLEVTLDPDAAGAALRSVPVLLAGIGLLRTLRRGGQAVVRTAAVAFAVLVGTGEAAALASGQMEGTRCGMYISAETRAQRLTRKRREAELFSGFTVLVAAIGALPARRVGARLELIAPIGAVFAAALCDPVPWLRRFEQDATPRMGAIPIDVCGEAEGLPRCGG